jgi:transposase-like protein
MRCPKCNSEMQYKLQRRYRCTVCNKEYRIAFRGTKANPHVNLVEEKTT